MQSKNLKKSRINRRSWVYRAQLSGCTKSRGHSALVIDNLAVNNILSFTNQNIKNRSILVHAIKIRFIA